MRTFGESGQLARMKGDAGGAGRISGFNKVAGEDLFGDLNVVIVGGGSEVDVSVLVETGETLKGGFNVFSRNVAYLLGAENADEPPVAIAVIEKSETVPLVDSGLAFHRSYKVVESIDEVKIDVLVWDRWAGAEVGLVVFHVVDIFLVFIDHFVVDAISHVVLIVAVVGVGVLAISICLFLVVV